jgi:hypothetical protein
MYNLYKVYFIIIKILLNDVIFAGRFKSRNNNIDKTLEEA